jgi:hypothetical protein
MATNVNSSYKVKDDSNDGPGVQRSEAGIVQDVLAGSTHRSSLSEGHVHATETTDMF